MTVETVIRTLPRTFAFRPAKKRDPYHWTASSAGAASLDLAGAMLGRSRPIALVSGFWRSGTTWLLELLAEALEAKSIFEPLSPINQIWDKALETAGLSEPDLRQAMILPRQPPNSAMWKYLDRAILGGVPSPSLLLCRRDLKEALRRRILVKDVRLQFNLEAVHRRYGIPVIHIRRHPCAVAMSLMEARWSWRFRDLPLGKILEMNGAAKIADFDTLLRDEDADEFSKIVTYWALTEKSVARQLCHRPWARIVEYETALTEPEMALSQLTTFMGRSKADPSKIRGPDFLRPSMTTSGHVLLEQKQHRFHDRAVAWQRALPRSQVRRARAIVDQILPDYTF